MARRGELGSVVGGGGDGGGGGGEAGEARRRPRRPSLGALLVASAGEKLRGARSWQSPVSLRVGTVGVGLGVGCGVGVGKGSPFNLRAVPGLNTVLRDTSAVQSAVGSIGYRAQGLLSRIGVRNIPAGVGCGIGFGYGFGAGLFLKPSIGAAMQQRAQEAVAGVGARMAGLTGADAVAAFKADSAPIFAQQTQSPVSAVPTVNSSAPPAHHEVQQLKQTNDLMRTLLRQQEQLETLKNENEALKKAVCKLDSSAPFCSQADQSA
eukprot:jgi/Chlat1/5351/Chrsp35S05272